MPDIRGMSDEQVGELSVEALLELKLIPVIARVSILPEDIGNTKSSCAQAELRALNLAMEMTPATRPKITIMDSSGVRGQGLKTRDERDQIPTRRKIRGLYSGAGKGDSRRLELNFEHEEEGDENIFVRTNHVSSLQLVRGIINLAKNE